MLGRGRNAQAGGLTPRSVGRLRLDVCLLIGAVLAVPIGCGDQGHAKAPHLHPCDLRSAVWRFQPLLLAGESYGFLKPEFASLCRVCSDLRVGSRGPERLAEQEAIARLCHADVVLVADIHTIDLARIGFAKAVDALLVNRAGNRVGVGAEALPASWQPLVDGLCREDAPLSGVCLRTLLLYSWPWPIAKLAHTLERAKERGCSVIGLGGIGGFVQLPFSLPDLSRAPPHPGDEALGEEQAAELFNRGNANAVAAVSSFLREGADGERKVVALFGLAHVADPHRGIPAALAAEGYSVVTVVPFLREFAEVQLEDPEAAIGEGWFELLPGMLYPPYVTGRDICEEAARR